MSGLPSGPKAKGALITQDPITLLPTRIPFQYNPTKLSRSLTPSLVGGGQGDRTQAPRYWGPPKEVLTVELQLSALEGIVQGDATTKSSGIAPLLAQLELIVYPPVAQIVADQLLLALGTIEIAPPLSPIVLFTWGSGRVVPVAIESMTVNEEAFDDHLNPVRATVELSMRTLNYTDVSFLNPVYALYMAHQASLEAEALKA